MSIEQAIYQRLSTYSGLTDLVGNRIYPTIPTTNTQLPLVIFTISSSEAQLHTQGASSLSNYTLELDIWAVNLDEVVQIAGQTKAAMHCYRGGVFQGIFLRSYNLNAEEEGYHEVQSYTVWAI